ncbi:PREDICTED: pathogenesis-related homeodomain protein isoform X1 [Theobroma cacao]|uniref:Pathogenesis-related homeodomain protein isoform X1 n=1 Tax=Theobroma cacao TaxID=3641 RepID=A0AB32X122_THECC|nr:PREDICTED: pathogenesis-related homeodomain protein isoform X1 [Theobroma cacao]
MNNEQRTVATSFSFDTVEISMRGTGKKVVDHESAKSSSSKKEAGSKLIATLQFKKRSKISHGRVRKPKYHVKKVGSALLKTKVNASISKGTGNDVSSSKKVGSKTNLHKANKKGSSKKLDSSKLQGKNAASGSSEENSKKANEDVRIKNLTKKKKKRQKDKVELDEASRLQRRTRYLLIKMKLEQNLIDAYSGEGWKGQSREKIKPEKELQRAKKQILKCKLGIREAIRQLDSLSSVGSIEGSVIAPDGSVYHEHIFCAKCKLHEAFPDNDIVLCDGTCNCAFHQKCLDPPLDTENIPPGEQGWFCKFCDCKMEIIEAMNAHIGTHFSVDSHWQDIFKDEAAFPDGVIASLNPEEEWPSDDSEDDDYDPERRENSCGISGAALDGDDTDDTDSSTSLSWSVDGEDFSGSGRRENHSVDSGADSYETSDGEIISGRRRRRAVDYKKLYDEMFGKDAPSYEQVSEDEDWGPGKRKRREKESDAASTLMTLYESETKYPKVETTEMRGQLPSDPKSRRPIFRIPPTAVEKLRQVFAENELPSRVIKENLSKELGLEPEKVNKWFKNARYLALKSRKVERADHLQSSSPGVSKESELEASKRKDPNIPQLEDTSKKTLLHTPKRLKKKVRKSPNSKSLHSSLRRSAQNGLSLVSPANSNKVRKELSDDVILKKLLKGKKKREKKRVNITVGGGLQQFELEMERLCRVKVRLENMRQTLLRLETSKARKLNKNRLQEESVIYIPIAEVKQKV